MKLENVDLAKLRLADVPEFDRCPCELCDDGCFDRSGFQHHPECRRKPVQRTNLSLARRCPLSHYQATFQAAANVAGGPADHRRQPCTPAPDNEIPISFRDMPMAVRSSQQDDYQRPSSKDIKNAATINYKPKNESFTKHIVPMETRSQYQLEYVEKPAVPFTMQPLKDSHMKITESNAPLSSVTTNRSHYQTWPSVRSYPYAEIPSSSEHVLFPGSSRNFSTSTGSTFVSHPNVSQARPLPRFENGGNLKVTGSMDLQTNYRESYKPNEPSSVRSAPSVTKEKSKEEKVYTRRPMNAVSQTSLDFRPYPNHRPSPPVEMEPFISQINIGNSLSRTAITSQYRADYSDIDRSRYQRQPPAIPKDRAKPYAAPIQKMDTLSVTQRDFQPIDVSSLPPIHLVPMRSTLSVNAKNVPMETVTMSQSHFQPYGSIKPQRFSDPLPDIYMPPLSKFEGKTTTGETFRGQPGSRARPYIPEIRMINQSGEHDHRTNYRIDYHPHGLTLCAAKAYAIAQNKKKSPAPIPAQ